MTVLVFPRDGEDMELAFNNALSRGAFCDDVSNPTFWGLYELLGSVTSQEDGLSVIDVFK